MGPAGRVLDRALDRAGIARADVYVTNVVKHFKYRARGKRRIHQRPNAAEITACRRWMEAELEFVGPESLVCLGATAGQALLGRELRIGRDRGQVSGSDLAPIVVLTTHPSRQSCASAAHRAAKRRSISSSRTFAWSRDQHDLTASPPRCASGTARFHAH